MKVDLHCHTEASPDCISPVGAVVDEAILKGMSVQAITDHNTIKGALEAKEYAIENDLDIEIIVGEEISTNRGELLGLFLLEKVEPGLSPQETVNEVKSQGGLVVLPHGFDPMKLRRLQDDAREEVKEGIDIVEVFNTRVSSKTYNTRAYDWALKNNKHICSGSDAHTLRDVGTAWTEYRDIIIKKPPQLLSALGQGNPSGKWVHPWLAFAFKVYDYFVRRILGYGKS